MAEGRARRRVGRKRTRKWTHRRYSDESPDLSERLDALERNSVDLATSFARYLYDPDIVRLIESGELKLREQREIVDVLGGYVDQATGRHTPPIAGWERGELRTFLADGVPNEFAENWKRNSVPFGVAEKLEKAAADRARKQERKKLTAAQPHIVRSRKIMKGVQDGAAARSKTYDPVRATIYRMEDDLRQAGVTSQRKIAADIANRPNCSIGAEAVRYHLKQRKKHVRKKSLGK